MTDQYVHLRQIATPTGKPQSGGTLLYVKSDGKLYTKDAAGVETPVETALGDVTLNGVQTLTNKDLSSATNTFPSSLATDAEVTSAVNTHAALTATHGATGAVVGTTNTQTLTNKTLSTGTKVGAATTDISGAMVAYTPAAANFTVGNGSLTGRYMQIGKLIFFRANFVSGTTSSYTATAATISLPVQAHATGEQSIQAFMNGNVDGVGRIQAGASVATPLFSASTTNPLLTGVTSTTFNPGAGTGGFLVIEGWYEAA